MNYTALVNDNQREDSYVNATKWCSAFGKRWAKFSELPTTQEYLKALSAKVSPESGLIQSKQGKGTWVHPMVAIALAKWLSPEFHVFVNQTFQRYLENDITLADEILQRATKQQAEWLLERAEGKVIRSELTSECVKRGCNGIGIGMNTNAVYKGLFNMDANELKIALDTKNPRDKMTKVELIATKLAEALAVEEMREIDAKGNKQTKDCSLKAGKRVARVFED